MSEQKKSLWARLVPTGDNQVKTINVDDLCGKSVGDYESLRSELSARLDRLQKRGVESISMTFQRGVSTTFEGMWVLNNVIRQYEEDALEFKTIGPSDKVIELTP